MFHFTTTSSELIDVSDAVLLGFLHTQYVSLSVIGIDADDPAIVQAIGYRGTSIQLHSVPPYVCSTFTSLVACYVGDRMRHRGTFVVVAGCVSIVGYAMYLSSTNPNVLYASLFLQIMGVYTVAPLQSTWMREFLSAGCHSLIKADDSKQFGAVLQAGNRDRFGFCIDELWRHSIHVSYVRLIFDCVADIRSWLFPTTEAPRYRKATSILIGLSSAMVVLAIVNSFYLHQQNRRRHRARLDGDLVDNSGQGDTSIHFKYIT